MAKQKRKLTAAEKAEKRRRRREYMTVFINGKQKRVKRRPTIPEDHEKSESTKDKPKSARRFRGPFPHFRSFAISSTKEVGE